MQTFARYPAGRVADAAIRSARRRPVTIGGRNEKDRPYRAGGRRSARVTAACHYAKRVGADHASRACQPAKVKKAPTAGQLAARERQKKCRAEWKAAKAAGKVEKGMTWPKYWSACNKRLKAAAGKS
jgi:hypothetical protein